MRMLLRVALLLLLLLLLLLVKSAQVTGLGAEHVTDFYVPFWAQAYNCSNGSCTPGEFFQKSFQILYVTTHESTEVNVAVTYQITNGSWGTLVTHFITVEPKETTAFDILNAFAEDLEEITETNTRNATSDIHHPWWIDQPVHIQVLGGGFVSIYAVSTIVNDTSVFPLYPILSSETDLSKLVIDTDYSNLRPSLYYVSAGVLVIKPLFNQTKMHITLTAKATAMCSLNFDYVESCDSDLQVAALEPSPYYTTWKSNSALILVATDPDAPKDQNFDFTSISTDKPTSVFLGKTGSVTVSEGTLTTFLAAQQIVDSRFWGYTFITVTLTATFISSSHPPFFDTIDDYYESTTWYIDRNFQDDSLVARFYVWDPSLNSETFTVHGNQLSASEASHIAYFNSDTTAIMRNFTARTTIAVEIYYIDGHQQGHSTLLTVPAVEQYQNNYTLPDPRYYLISRDAASNHSYFVTVIIPCKYIDTGNIMLDGKPIPRDAFLSFNTSEGPAFYATKVKLDYVNLTHELYHTHQDGRFGVTVFGFTGHGESTRNLYAFSSASQIETTELHAAETSSSFKSTKMTTIIAVTAGTGGLGVVMLIVMITLTVYAVRTFKRWKNYRQRYNPLQSINSLLRRKVPDGANCQYDVFLSFADEDREFVEAYLYGPLEEGGFRVCWHHRDFPPGYSIIENIKNSIDHSRRVVLVLSEHFHRSEYCLFELRYSCEKMLATHTQFVIPVVLQQESLPRELDHLTYWKVNPEQPDPSDIEAFIQVLGSPIHAPQEVA